MNVSFTDYALLRMHQRDMLPDEVTEAIAAGSDHRRRSDGRYEVKLRIANRVLIVVYRRDGSEAIVINAMWETL